MSKKKKPGQKVKPAVKNKTKTIKKPVPKWFYAVLVAIPVVAVILLEIFLRVINYGLDFTEFQNFSSYYPNKQFLNPDLPYKYFINIEKAPTTLPDGFDIVKKKNAFRVFVIGGSTTAGWPYVPNASFSRHLKRRLELLYPYNTIEVINCGISAINSYTLLDFIPGILKQKPDLVLIYAGHNEYYGALGAGSSVSLGHSRTLVNTYLWFKNFRVTQLIENVVEGIYSLFKSEDEQNDLNRHETLMARMIGESLITLNSDTYFDGIEQFEGNLDDILEELHDANVPVILGDLTSNTLDVKPFVSVKTDTLPAASDIYKLAKKKLGEGQVHTADSLFTWAKELDALRFRAPQKMNEVINRLGKKYGYSIVNIDSVFRSKSKYGIVGYNLTVDHLHPNLTGYGLIAEEYFKRMEKLNLLPEGKKMKVDIARQDSILDANFPFTRLDSTLAQMQIIQLTGAYPFVPKGTPNYKALNFKVKDLVDSLAVQVINKDIKWETAHTKLADRYLAQGNYKGFVKEMSTIIAERPYFDQPYKYIVVQLAEKGQVKLAFPYLVKLHNFKPSYFTNKWLGQIYLYEKLYEPALNYLVKAVKYKDADYQTWYNLAGAYYFKGEISKALQAIQTSLKLNSNNKLARNFYKQLVNQNNKKKQ